MDTSSFSLFSNSYHTCPSSLLLGDTVCRILPVASCKTHSLQPKSSRGKTYAANSGGSASSRKNFLGRAVKEDEFSTPTSINSKSSSRESLISLFKRIQLEISGEKSGGGIYSKSSQSSIGDDSSAKTSVLEFLQQSDRETKVDDSKLKHSEESTHHIETTKKEKSRPTPQPPSTNKFTRPPSKFVKRSPIPSSTPSQSADVEVTNTEMSSSEADKESSIVEDMKLSELKKLAKERGIRGYSKLKKIELIQLLKS